MDKCVVVGCGKNGIIKRCPLPRLCRKHYNEFINRPWRRSGRVGYIKQDVYCKNCRAIHKRSECDKNIRGGLICPICHKQVRLSPYGTIPKERLKAKIDDFIKIEESGRGK